MRTRSMTAVGLIAALAAGAGGFVLGRSAGRPAADGSIERGEPVRVEFPAGALRRVDLPPEYQVVGVKQDQFQVILRSGQGRLVTVTAVHPDAPLRQVIPSRSAGPGWYPVPVRDRVAFRALVSPTEFLSFPEGGDLMITGGAGWTKQEAEVLLRGFVARDGWFPATEAAVAEAGEIDAWSGTG